MYENLMLLKDIVDNTPMPIAVYSGKELKIELANPAMIHTWGKGDQVLGKTYRALLPEIHDQGIIDQALSVLQTGVPFHAVDKKVELLINGALECRYFNYSFIPLKKSDGTVYGVMNTGIDITELHYTKQQAVNSNEKLKIALDSSGMGMYEIDLDTQTVNSCRNFKEICFTDAALTNEELIAKIHPQDLPLREKAHLEAGITGRIYYEARIVNDDQSYKWVRINGKIIKDENGSPAALIGIIQDIHEQKQFEEELQRQVKKNTRELQRSNDDLLHFANVVSHDLREPIRKIEIFSGLLNEQLPDMKEHSQRYLERISRSARRMNGIIEGILAYSTLDKKKQSVEMIDLNEVVENIKMDLELIIKEKGAVVITSELPRVEGAPILIQQLFYNLIQNALKFSKTDVPPRVTILCVPVTENGRDMVQITISDNGIGLDPIFTERIFGAFERLHSKDQYEGNGLGLSLCRKIALRHKGSIKASGKVNSGADFIVTLPLRQYSQSI